MKLIVQMSGVIKLACITRRRVFVWRRIQNPRAPLATVRLVLSPPRRSAITHSSTEASTHHGAEKQGSPPSQLNLTGVLGVNNENEQPSTKGLAAQCWPHPQKEKKNCNRKSSKENQVKHFSAHIEKKNEGKKK